MKKIIFLVVGVLLLAVSSSVALNITNTVIQVPKPDITNAIYVVPKPDITNAVFQVPEPDITNATYILSTTFVIPSGYPWVVPLQVYYLD